MTLNSYGWATTLEELGREIPHDSGVTALDIVHAAQKRGLGVRGYELSVAELPTVVVPGDILHLRESHFVVVDRVTGGRIHLLDPADGARVATLEQFAREYSGVALLFAQDPSALDLRLESTGP